jgi:hypothetical protein
MSNIVKKMNKLSLFLVGLVVAFNVASCGCGDGDGKLMEFKPSEKKKVKFKAEKDIEVANLDKTKIEATGFKQNGKDLKACGVTAKIEKNKEFEVEFEAESNASEGEVTIKVTDNTDNSKVADLKVKVVKK